jgi:hypothetical protein
MFQTYHRKQSPTQTSDDARRQERSLEIWGKAARGSDIPKVKAYPGFLPDGEKGIEFVTDIPPDSGSPPTFAYWSAGRSDISFKEVNGETFAVLKVIQVINRQQ